MAHLIFLPDKVMILTIHANFTVLFFFWFGIMHLQWGVDWSSLLITNYTNRKSSAILIECKKCFNSLKGIHSMWKRLPTLTPEGYGRTHYHVNRSQFAANCCYHQLLFPIFCKFLSHRNRKRKSVSWTSNGSFYPLWYPGIWIPGYWFLLLCVPLIICLISICRHLLSLSHRVPLCIM